MKSAHVVALRVPGGPDWGRLFHGKSSPCSLNSIGVWGCDPGALTPVPDGVTAISCVPGGEALDFEEKDGRAGFAVPEVEGHQMVEIRTG